MSGSFAPPSSGGSGAVSSVFTRTGAVVAQSGDYSAAQVGATPSSHASASANVHGLPASVNVLGDRAAAGEYIQRGSNSSSTTSVTPGIESYTRYRAVAVTFPQPFATGVVPKIFLSGPWVYSYDSPSNTGFTAYQYDNMGAASNTVTFDWFAIGS